MELQLPGPVVRALSILGEAGFEAYLVGGCVRDALLHQVPGDWDLAASARPEEIAACFSPHGRVIPLGQRHGTMTVVLGGLSMEITTFRVDGGYSDARRPDSVRFTRDIREDLARRDFTINAMAYHPATGLLDPFGGEMDTARGLIRCVGDPDARFQEDALRIMRALRFLAQHSFAIDPPTAAALLRHRERLGRISAERLAHELDRLICGENAGGALRTYVDVFAVFLPELRPMVGFQQRTPWHRYDVYEHTVRVVENTVPRREVRLAALLHDSGKPDCFRLDENGGGHFYGHPALSAQKAEEILTRLRYDKRTRELVCTLVEHHDAYIPPEPLEIRRWLARLGEKRLRLLLELKTGDCLGQGVKPERVRDIEAAKALLEEQLRAGAPLSFKDLALSGKDLLELGVPAGPQIGKLLSLLLAQAVDGACENDRDALLREARRLLRDPRRLIDGLHF